MKSKLVKVYRHVVVKGLASALTVIAVVSALNQGDCSFIRFQPEVPKCLQK